MEGTSNVSVAKTFFCSSPMSKNNKSALAMISYYQKSGKATRVGESRNDRGWDGGVDKEKAERSSGCCCLLLVVEPGSAV